MKHQLRTGYEFFGGVFTMTWINRRRNKTSQNSVRNHVAVVSFHKPTISDGVFQRYNLMDTLSNGINIVHTALLYWHEYSGNILSQEHFTETQSCYPMCISYIKSLVISHNIILMDDSKFR